MAAAQLHSPIQKMNGAPHSGGSINQDGNDISEFVDLTKIKTDVTRTSEPRRKRSSIARPDPHDFDIDMEIARMEHLDTLPSNVRAANGSLDPARQRKLESLEKNYGGS